MKGSFLLKETSKVLMIFSSVKSSEFSKLKSCLSSFNFNFKIVAFAVPAKGSSSALTIFTEIVFLPSVVKKPCSLFIAKKYFCLLIV